MYKLYNLNRVTFLIVGDHNNPLGIINHSDLNSLPFLHVMWDIFYNFEIKLTNYLMDKFNEQDIISKFYGDEKKAYNTDKKNGQELKPIFYLNLSHKIQLSNDFTKTNKIEVDAHFRNNMAHPRSKPRVISRKSEIPGLYLTLIGIDNFLSP